LDADPPAQGVKIARRITHKSDIVFLQGVANILGMAIERQRIEGNLRQAVDCQQLLMKEVNHRVNNSLSIVASMLRLQGSANPEH
jgi:two-component sensor histidine kinase